MQLCRCVICQQLSDNTYACGNGHLTCRGCLVQQNVASGGASAACAVCRENSAWVRSLLSRQILAALEASAGCPIIECDNDGCNARLLISGVDAHRARCAHRMVLCPHASCDKQLPLHELPSHILTHEDSVPMRESVPLTLLTTNFTLRHVLLVHHKTHGLHVFLMDCVGIFGNGGSFGVYQGLMRVCCLTPSRAAWSVLVENRGIDAACEVRETFRARVPDAPDLRACKPVAHPTVVAWSGSPPPESFFHVGDDVKEWWGSARLIVKDVVTHDHTEYVQQSRDGKAAVLLMTVTLVAE